MSGMTLSSLHISSLNTVDIVILIIFVISALVGFGRGLIGEILALLILVVAFIVAILFSNQLADFFSQTSAVHNATQSANTTEANTTLSYMLLGVSFGVLFVGTVIIGSIIKLLLHLVIGRSVFGFGNRFLGGLFGLVRGYLVNLALIFLIELSPFTTQQWWIESQFVPLFQSQVVWLGKVVSPSLANLKQTLDEEMNNAEKNKAKIPSTKPLRG